MTDNPKALLPIASNMQLVDVLAILGRVGTVTLRKGTNDTSATPGYKANTEGWTCEIKIRGYLVPYRHGGPGGTGLYLGASARDLTADEAARLTLAALEQFLESEQAAICRACYLADVEWHNARATDQVAGYGETVYRKRRIAPEAKIQWGDAA